jgi:Phosphotransferase enzyme family
MSLTTQNALTLPDIAHWLLERKLISECAIVEGGFTVLDASRRNTNFKVVSAHGPSYLVKQGLGVEREGTLANEAAVYSVMYSAPAFVELRRHLPSLILYSPEEHVAVFGLVENAPNLKEYHSHIGRFPASVAKYLGRAFGVLHRAQLPDHEHASLVRLAPPWPLTLHRPSLDLYGRMSNANLQLVSAMQGFPAFGMLLDALKAKWQAESLVHYDVKLDNLLVVRDNVGRINGVKLVDWELSGLGDPAWDIGSVFGEYLSFWLLSIPVMGDKPPEQFVEMARYQLGDMQPALAAFWRSYKEDVGLSSQTAAPFLWRAVSYSACRLVQTAFESGQGSNLLTGNALWFLQLSFNVLQRPFEAAAHLLGITEP